MYYNFIGLYHLHNELPRALDPAPPSAVSLTFTVHTTEITKRKRGIERERYTHRVQAKYFISRKGCATQSAKSRNLAYTLDHVTHHQEQSRPVLEKQKVGRKEVGRCGSCGTAALFAQDTLGRPGTAASLDRRCCCCSCRYKDTPQITLGDR